MARKRKRARRVHKKSWLEKLFTFPLMALYLFLALSVFTIYQVVQPAESVMGVTNPDDLMFVTEEEQQAIIQNAAKDQPPTFHQLAVFKDANNNAKYGDYEDCLDRTVTFVVNNKERTRWGCDDIIIYSKSRIATITLKAVTGFRFTGLTYQDNTTSGGTRTLLNGAHSVTVKGIPYGYPQSFYYTNVDFGVHKK